MMKPRGGYVFDTPVYIHIYNDFTMMRFHDDTIMVTSTTGSYGRLVIEVAYGETLIHSTKIVGRY